MHNDIIHYGIIAVLNINISYKAIIVGNVFGQATRLSGRRWTVKILPKEGFGAQFCQNKLALFTYEIRWVRFSLAY
jgi:hypothetical protein